MGRRAAVVVAAALGVLAAAWLGAFDLPGLRARYADWKRLADANPAAAVVLFGAVYVAATALSLPVATWLTLLAGALFGRAVGVPLVSVSSTVGATLAMLAARTVLRDWVRRRFGPRVDALDRGLARGGVAYLVSLRLVLVAPFWLVNLAAGVTAMRVRTYAFGTWFGMLPATVLFVHAGAELGAVESPRDILTPRVIGAFALLALLPLAARWAVRRFLGERGM